MRLSPHFTLAELTRSSKAAELGIDNTPDPEAKACLVGLCENILEPVRTHFGVPITPSSGFRCAEMNKAIGGSKTSQHVLGQAVDFSVPGVSTAEVADWIYRNLDFDQLILEFPDRQDGGWVHVSLNSAHNRHDAKIALKDAQGKTEYTPIVSFLSWRALV